MPIDTSRLQFLAVAGAEPLKKFEEGKPRDAWVAAALIKPVDRIELPPRVAPGRGLRGVLLELRP